jgi:hypothetical protein
MHAARATRGNWGVDAVAYTILFIKQLAVSIQEASCAWPLCGKGIDAIQTGQSL